MAAQIHLGYGINVSKPNSEHLAWAGELGMEWIKVYSATASWPSKTLRRIPANWQDYDNLDTYCAEVKSYVSPQIDAYEIGNEPNLDWAWSEGTADVKVPDPYQYTQVLKTAYTCIKQVNPDAIVVSGGLATVGPYDKEADPPGYPQAWNDLKFLQAMYDYGAQDYFDALGSHPYGFYFPPEQDPGGWAYNPIYGDMYVDGLAFRRAEQQREVMVANGDVNKQIWATEWGWLLRQEACQSEWETQGRWWQVVDEATQAEYIQRAFEYAHDHWPWMGPMFLFNLDFSLSGYPPCDAMNYYAIRGSDGSPRQAYTTLRDMPKWPYAVVTPEAVNLLIDDKSPGVYTRTVRIDNIGAAPLTYTVSAAAPWLAVPSGVYTGSGVITLTVNTLGFVPGTTYTAPATVTTNSTPTHMHRPITVTVLVADDILNTFLPLIIKDFHQP